MPPSLGPVNASQRRLASPVHRVSSYPAARAAAAASSESEEGGEEEGEVEGEVEVEGEEDKHFVSVGWVLNHDEVLDPLMRMSLTLVDHLLMGTHSSPLRCAHCAAAVSVASRRQHWQKH